MSEIISEMEKMGVVTGISTPKNVFAIVKNDIKNGAWVVIESGSNQILGIVSATEAESRALSRVYNHEEAQEAKYIPTINPRDMANRVEIKIIGTMDDLVSENLNVPNTPITPGSEIRHATSAELQLIFDKQDGSQIKLARLSGAKNVDVGVDVEALSQHVGIFGMSGMGKSNLIAQKLIAIDEMEGTGVVYDYHADYTNLPLKNLNLLQPVINPIYLDADEFGSLIGISSTATNQQNVFARGFNREVKNSRDFWNELINQIRLANQDPIDAVPVSRVIRKVENAEKYLKIIDPNCSNPIKRLEDGKINVLDLHDLSEAQAKIIVNFYMSRIFNDRKKCLTQKSSIFSTVVLQVVEEAHIYLAERAGKVKETISSVAREGRKFGCLLLIASQRPRALDPLVLSQIGSLGILRIINEEDLRMVAATSEFLSAEMINHVKGLAVGSAILVGNWTKVPVIVDTYHVQCKKVGTNLSILKSWQAK